MHRIKIWFAWFLWPSEQYTYFLRSHFFLTHPVDISRYLHLSMWMSDTENMSTYSSWTGSIVCRASATSSPATMLGSLLLLPDNRWSRFHIDITISHALLLLSQTDDALQLWRCRYTWIEYYNIGNRFDLRLLTSSVSLLTRKPWPWRIEVLICT